MGPFENSRRWGASLSSLLADFAQTEHRRSHPSRVCYQTGTQYRQYFQPMGRPISSTFLLLLVFLDPTEWYMMVSLWCGTASIETTEMRELSDAVSRESTWKVGCRQRTPSRLDLRAAQTPFLVIFRSLAKDQVQEQSLPLNSVLFSHPKDRSYETS